MQNIDISESVNRLLSQVIQNLVNFTPVFILTIFILLFGFFIARLLRGFARRFLKNISRFIPNKKIQERLSPEKLEKSAHFISNILYWTIIFFFLTVATETLGLPVITTWFSGIINYIPKLIVAVLIIITGIFGGLLLYSIISSAAESAGITYANLLGKTAQYSIIFITILIGIDHIGINITFLSSLILIVTSALLFSAGLAFALGARFSVSNILASHYIKKRYKVGQIIKINNTEGQIVELTPISVILETAEGQVCIPAGFFNETTSILVREVK